MTANAAPDLVSRLQEWLSTADTAWKRDHQWLVAQMVEALMLLNHQHAELTACRAEQARLQEDLAACYRLTGADPDGNTDESLAAYAVNEVKDLRRNHDKLAAQVSTLIAALRRLIGKWEYRVRDMERASDGETWQGEMTEIRRCADEVAAVLRAASEGA